MVGNPSFELAGLTPPIIMMLPQGGKCTHRNADSCRKSIVCVRGKSEFSIRFNIRASDSLLVLDDGETLLLPASAAANQINNDYAIAYFPTIYRICPNRIIEEVGQLGASALYATVSACPPPASAPADVAALSYTGAAVHCEGAYTPSVDIQNNGTSPLTACTIR